MSQPIFINNVRKRFGTTVALRAVALDVTSSESCAIVGENGAGKSTLLAICAGMLRPDSGEVRVFGARPWRRHEFMPVSKRVGVVLSSAFLYPQFSVLQNLQLFAALYGVEPRSPIDHIIARFGLETFLSRPVGELSQGMTKRVALARAMLHDPELLILDEPFAHLDEEWKQRFAALLAERSARGFATLFSSHEPELISRSKARVVELSQGVSCRQTGVVQEAYGA